MSDLVVLPIDVPTLAISRGLMQIMLAGLLVYVGGQQEQRSGARLWAAGFLLNGLSLFLFAIQVPGAWETPVTVLNHFGLGVASACFLLGFWKFGHQPAHPWLVVLMLAIPLASLLAWELLWPNARLRVLCTAAGQALYLLALQHSLRRASRKELAQIYRRLRVLVLFYLIVFVVSYANIADLLPTSARLSADYHRVLFSVISLLFMLSLAVACLALQFALLAARNADLAMVDWLTGLLNRRGFFDAASRADGLRSGRTEPLSVIALDIDHFKKINDRYGHAAGDRVLQALGDRLRQLTEASHLVARMGGEEFCIVLPGCRGESALDLAQALRASCSATAVPSEDGQTIRFSFSAGVHEASPQQSLDEALALADEALYRAKADGRNRIVLGSKAIQCDN